MKPGQHHMLSVHAALLFNQEKVAERAERKFLKAEAARILSGSVCVARTCFHKGEVVIREAVQNLRCFVIAKEQKLEPKSDPPSVF